MKRKIAMLAIAAMFAVALVGGGVYAYFNDTETSTGNQFTAGSLDLVLGGSGSTSMSFSDLAPGSSGASSMMISNDGSIAGALSLTVQNMVDDEGIGWEPETNTAAPGDLSANVDIAVFIDADGDGVQDAGESSIWTGKLSALASVSASLGNLAGSASTYIGIAYSVATSVGNDIMGDIVTFDIVFTLQQN